MNGLHGVVMMTDASYISDIGHVITTTNAIFYQYVRLFTLLSITEVNDPPPGGRPVAL